MKFLVIVAMFAFVAVQLSQSFPAPDGDVKKEVAAPAAVALEASSPAAPVEKSAPEAVASLAQPAAAVPQVEEKKS
ncbi:unnamed protein product [Euphydryas editha]|uniref:Uncharacterized protein n=1 Tax=Euphydryas editha TaxID=104508 RepID=A0AAU9UDX9_EUPED|nr:unnamed protein product [Euphydryas editha]